MKIEHQGNGNHAKTHVTEFKDDFQGETYKIVKFIQAQLGTTTKYNEQKDTIIINGIHSKEDLSLLFKRKMIDK